MSARHLKDLSLDKEAERDGMEPEGNFIQTDMTKQVRFFDVAIDPCICVNWLAVRPCVAEKVCRPHSLRVALR